MLMFLSTIKLGRLLADNKFEAKNNERDKNTSLDLRCFLICILSFSPGDSLRLLMQSPDSFLTFLVGWEYSFSIDFPVYSIRFH